MTYFRPLTLALAATLACTSIAHAQDADAGDFKRFSVTAGVGIGKNTGSATVGGVRAHADNEAAATLGATYHVTDHIGIEAWGADKMGQRIRTSTGKVASANAQPVALSGQYRFGDSSSTVRPFVGLGYHETNYDDETTQDGNALAGQRLGMETAKGPMATAGVDVNFSPRWFGRADVRYLHGNSDVQLNGADAGEAKLDPVVAGLSVGARF